MKHEIFVHNVIPVLRLSVGENGWAKARVERNDLFKLSKTGPRDVLCPSGISLVEFCICNKPRNHWRQGSRRPEDCTAQESSPDKSCRFRRSTQHLLGVSSQGFGILKSFWGVDASAARPGRAAPENRWAGRYLGGSIAATGRWPGFKNEKLGGWPGFTDHVSRSEQTEACGARFYEGKEAPTRMTVPGPMASSAIRASGTIGRRSSSWFDRATRTSSAIRRLVKFC